MWWRESLSLILCRNLLNLLIVERDEKQEKIHYLYYVSKVCVDDPNYRSIIIKGLIEPR